MRTVWRNHHGSFAPVSSDALGQVGTMYPGPRDEPGRQGRDGPLGLLIAPGILLRLVPGSPAALYLGCRRPALKLIRRLFEHFRQPLQRGGEVLLRRPGSGGLGRGAGGKLVALAGKSIDLFV